jgi:hypothetical protein
MPSGLFKRVRSLSRLRAQAQATRRTGKATHIWHITSRPANFKGKPALSVTSASQPREQTGPDRLWQQARSLKAPASAPVLEVGLIPQRRLKGLHYIPKHRRGKGDGQLCLRVLTRWSPGSKGSTARSVSGAARKAVERTSGTLRETSGSPALGAGSNWRLSQRRLVTPISRPQRTHKVYFSFSSSSMMAA